MTAKIIVTIFFSVSYRWPLFFFAFFSKRKNVSQLNQFSVITLFQNKHRKNKRKCYCFFFHLLLTIWEKEIKNPLLRHLPTQFLRSLFFFSNYDGEENDENCFYFNKMNHFFLFISGNNVLPHTYMALILSNIKMLGKKSVSFVKIHLQLLIVLINTACIVRLFFSIYAKTAEYLQTNNMLLINFKFMTNFFFLVLICSDSTYLI